MKWLTPQLKNEIRKVFEPKYKRKLSEDEVGEIAENLSGVVEAILEYKSQQKYGSDNREGKKDIRQKSRKNDR